MFSKAYSYGIQENDETRSCQQWRHIGVVSIGAFLEASFRVKLTSYNRARRVSAWEATVGAVLAETEFQSGAKFYVYWSPNLIFLG